LSATKPNGGLLVEMVTLGFALLNPTYVLVIPAYAGMTMWLAEVGWVECNETQQRIVSRNGHVGFRAVQPNLRSCHSRAGGNPFSETTETVAAR
jgi:hypothetical protein